METLAIIGSAIIFLSFSILVLFVLINISSRLALIILLLVPVLSILLLPDTSISFLSYRQMLLADGIVPINNFHILLMLWSALISMILYTEFLTWYLAKGSRMRKERNSNSSSENLKGLIWNVKNTIEKVKADLQNRLA